MKLHFSRHALALAVLALSATSGAWAGDLISTASASIDNLRYRLIDLDPNDGIAPALSVNGVWLASVMSTEQPQYIQYGYPSNFTESYTNTPLSYSGVLPFQGGTASAGLPDGTVSSIATGSSLAVSSQISKNDLLTAQSNLDPYSGTLIGYHDGYAGTWDYTRQDIASIATARRDALLAGAAPGGVMAASDPANPTRLDLQLTAHTLLVIEGTSTASVTADRSNLTQSFQQPVGSTYLYDLQEGHNVAVYSQRGNGYASAGVNVRLTDNADLVSPYGGSGDGTLSTASMDVSLNYDQNGMGAWYEQQSADMTSSASQSKSWAVQLSNLDDAGKTLYLGLGVSTSLSQVYEGNVSTIDAHFVPDEFQPPITPGIPEPGTYALMGLGLVGVALARRRATQR